MNNQASIAFVGAAALAVLLGCSTPQPVALVATEPAGSALPEWETDLPLEAPQAEPFGFCKLGTSCLAMDPRPFELCLLSTKDCRDKATEPLLVDEPQEMAPPAIIKTR